MKSLKELKGYLIVICYALSLVMVDMLIRVSIQYQLFSIKAILFSTFFACILAAVGLLFKGKGRLWFYYITLFMFSGLGLGQVIYYRFYKSFFSVNQMTNLMELGTVGGEIVRVLEPKNLLFLIPIIFLVVAGIFLKTYQNRKKSDYSLIVALILVAVGGSLVTKVTLKDADGESSSYQGDQYLFDTIFDKEKAMGKFGLYQYTLKDIELSITRRVEKTEVSSGEYSMLDTYFDELEHTHVSNEKSGYFEGKNVVYVMAESLFDRALNPNTMPTLTKLINEGLYFDNFYAPKYIGSTSDTEFISNTSLVPSVHYGTTPYEFSENYFPNSLAQNFKEAGYTAQSFHSNTGDFYNRFNYHEALGYESFYDQTALNLEFLPEWEYMVNWPSDTDLIDASADIFLENDQFFSYIITTNGHTPYTTKRTELLENYEFVKPFIDSSDDEIV
ncbi:MAG: LTA synthase family protein, partial [Turicibacter sp.]